MMQLWDVEVKSRKIEIVLILAVFLASLPLILNYGLLILSSFSTEMVTNLDPTSFRPTIDNWILLFEGRLSVTGGVREDVVRYTINTAIVALGVAGVVVLVSVMAGYAMSRMNFKGRSLIMQMILLLHAFPGVALIIAVYLIFRATLPSDIELARIYSFAYVIVARAALEIPMSIWLIKGFFDRVPWEVEWAAIIDGASRLRVWREVMLPMVKPGIAAIAIFAFLAGWEDLIYVRTFLFDRTLATYIESNINVEFAYMPLLAAAGTLYLLPTILFFILTQRLLLETSTGGIKG